MEIDLFNSRPFLVDLWQITHPHGVVARFQSIKSVDFLDYTNAFSFVPKCQLTTSSAITSFFELWLLSNTTKMERNICNACRNLRICIRALRRKLGMAWWADGHRVCSNSLATFGALWSFANADKNIKCSCVMCSPLRWSCNCFAYLNEASVFYLGK